MDLIIVPFHDYKKWINEGFRTRDSHLFTEFKKSEEVEKILIINRPISLIEMILKKRKWKTSVGTKIAGEKDWQLDKVDDKIYYLDIFSKDIFRVIVQRKKWWNTIFNKKNTLQIVNNVLDILNMNNRILFLENPMATSLIGNINEEKVVFDAIDNWLYHPQMKKIKKIVEKNYKYIGEKADYIVTVSKSLKEYFEKINNNVEWVSNGVDIERFKNAQVEDLKKRNLPVIGYMGKIQDRVDFDIIEKCLKTFENKFLILGPIYSQKEKIRDLKEKYKNIEFCGDIHYNYLPEKMKEFDIAIMPHKIDEFTNSMNPLKIYEYLAAGKITVTTPVAGIEEFDEYVYVAKTDEEFVNEIKRAIEVYNKTKNLSEKVRKKIAFNNLWEYKAKYILKKIKEC